MAVTYLRVGWHDLDSRFVVFNQVPFLRHILYRPFLFHITWYLEVFFEFWIKVKGTGCYWKSLTLQVKPHCYIYIWPFKAVDFLDFYFFLLKGETLESSQTSIFLMTIKYNIIGSTTSTTQNFVNYVRAQAIKN